MWGQLQCEIGTLEDKHQESCLKVLFGEVGKKDMAP